MFAVVEVPGRVGVALGVLVARAAAGMFGVRRGLVGVVRPDAVPPPAGRFETDNAPPRRRVGDDVVRSIPGDIDLDADDDVGAA